MATFADSNNTIFEMKMPTTAGKEVVFSLVENKKSGALKMGVREWKHSESYDGPTRNGMLIPVDSPETVDRWKAMFNDYFDKVRETL